MSGFTDDMYKQIKAYYFGDHESRKNVNGIKIENDDKREDEENEEDGGGEQRQLDLTTNSHQNQKRLLKKMPHNYHVSEGMYPSFWFAPVEVWEIAGAEVTVSPGMTLLLFELSLHCHYTVTTLSWVNLSLSL